MSVETLVLVMIWGTVVGLDLIAVFQVMIARPLVAGTVTGLLVGDVGAGFTVGAILELFALEILPFGAARYADYGVGAVAAAVTAAGAPGIFGGGVGVGLGLLVAYGGEVGIQLVRRFNSVDLRRHETAVDAGDFTAISWMHVRGLMREAVRAALLVGVGLAAALLVRAANLVSARGAVAVYALVVGVGLANATVGTLRLAGASRSSLGWLGAGLAAGILVMVLQ